MSLDVRANYRTPQSIGRYIEDVLSPGLRWPNDLPGMGVGVHPYDDPHEQLKLAGKIVQGLMRAGSATRTSRSSACGDTRIQSSTPPKRSAA